MLLETLLVVFSMIAMGSLFFLIYITWTLNDSLQDNDDVINELQEEIDRLRSSKQDMYINHTHQIGILKSQIVDLDKKISDLEEIGDLDQNRIIRLNNTIEKCEEKIQMQQRLMSFKEDNQ